MNKCIRILFHSSKSFYNFTDIYEYATLLASNKHFSIYYLGFNHKPGIFNEENVTVIHIRNEQLSKKIVIARKLKEIIQSEKIDIVHVFHYRGSGLFPLNTLFRGTPRWILDVRTIHVENKKAKVTNRFEGFLKDRLTWIESLTYNYKLALTKKIKRRLWPSFKKTNIIPLGVSDKRFTIIDRNKYRYLTREKLGIPKNSIVLLYSGSLSPSRNINVLLKAISKSMEDHPLIYAIILGDYRSDDYLNELKSIFVKEQLSNVIFLGQVSYPDIPKYYTASDIGLSYTPVNTPYAYQPPTKILEYMMSGLITVSNKTIETEKLIKHQVSGILTDDDIHSVYKGIIRAFEIVGQNGRIIEQAYMDSNEYTWKKIVEGQLIPFYSKILKVSGR